MSNNKLIDSSSRNSSSNEINDSSCGMLTHDSASSIAHSSTGEKQKNDPDKKT